MSRTSSMDTQMLQPFQNKASVKARRDRGTGFVDAVAMGLILVLVALALFDFLVVAFANSVNDAAAKNAARAAANQSDPSIAADAATKAVPAVSGFITELTLLSLDYKKNDVVTAKTKMEVKLPVPFPCFGDKLVFMASDTEAILTSSH